MIVEEIDQNGNFLFDASFNADSRGFEVLFSKTAENFLLQFDDLIEKLPEAKRLVEEDLQTAHNDFQ